MRVKELREELANLADDMLVVLSKDGEGNGFSPLDDIGYERYIADSTWSGDLVDEEADPDTGVPCVVLWPTN